MRVRAFSIIFAVIFVLASAPAQAEPCRILIYGDSNTWGYIARSDGAPTARYARDQRWTGRLQKSLGRRYEVVEDGLNLRTTDLDGEEWPGSMILPGTFNGAAHLPTSIAANMPLDLVVIMLGTNDLQARYDRSAVDVAAAAVKLAEAVRRSQGGVGTAYGAPEVLLVSPVQMSVMPIAAWRERYAGGREKSQALGAAFEKAARIAKLPMFDAAKAIGGAVRGMDGLHLSIPDHQQLAEAIEPEIKNLMKCR